MSSVRASWLSLQKVIGWLPVIFLGAILITGLSYIFLKALDIRIEFLGLKSVKAYKTVTDDDISAALVQSDIPSKNIIAAGAVVDLDGSAINGATVKLSAYTTDGHLVWSTTSQTNGEGIFTFHESEIPPVKEIFGAVLTAEAPNYLADKKNVQVSEQPITPPATPPQQEVKRLIRITPSLNRIPLIQYNSWLTIIVLMPAIFGLLFAILHLTRYSLGMWVTYWYAFGTAALWSAVVAEMIGIYVARGYALIPLFWPDLFVSSGVVIFAFIGSIVYVAFSMHDKGKTSFFDSDMATRRKILLTVGGRVLVAPYIALTAYGIMAATFPTIRTGPFAAFFGFFTGLWIKVVLEMLNDIGMRFLSAESAQKVVDRMKSTEVSDAQQMASSSAASLKPDQAFLNAVAEARKELLQKENVIGVAPGFKLTDPGARKSEQAIIVYVYSKENLAEGDPSRVPDTFRGFPTDVIALPPAGPDAICHTEMSRLSWRKIHQDNLNRLGGMPITTAASRVNQTEILMVLDPNETLFNSDAGNDFSIFDVLGAYQAVKPLLGDNGGSFDFVSFAISNSLGMPSIVDYHVPVRNSIHGINYQIEGNPGASAEPDIWSNEHLRACIVRGFDPQFSFYRYLHELVLCNFS